MNKANEWRFNNDKKVTVTNQKKETRWATPTTTPQKRLNDLFKGFS